MVQVWATLNWQSADAVPGDLRLPDFPETVRFRLSHSAGPEPTTRLVTGELRALDVRELSGALDLFLRTLTVEAALTDAVLETSAIRQSNPRSAPATLVSDAACKLWRSGFRVTFGPSWEPVAAETGLALGIAGDDGGLQELVSDRNFLETTPRLP